MALVLETMIIMMFSMNTHLFQQACFGLNMLFDPGNRSGCRFISQDLHTHTHTGRNVHHYHINNTSRVRLKKLRWLEEKEIARCFEEPS